MRPSGFLPVTAKHLRAPWRLLPAIRIFATGAERPDCRERLCFGPARLPLRCSMLTNERPAGRDSTRSGPRDGAATSRCITNGAAGWRAGASSTWIRSRTGRAISPTRSISRAAAPIEHRRRRVQHRGESDAMRLLVTGGSGFIGTNLVAHCIQQGIDVLNLDSRPPITKWRAATIRAETAVQAG